LTGAPARRCVAATIWALIGASAALALATSASRDRAACWVRKLEVGVGERLAQACAPVFVESVHVISRNWVVPTTATVTFDWS